MDARYSTVFAAILAISCSPSPPVAGAGAASADKQNTPRPTSASGGGSGPVATVARSGRAGSGTAPTAANSGKANAPDAATDAAADSGTRPPAPGSANAANSAGTALDSRPASDAGSASNTSASDAGPAADADAAGGDTSMCPDGFPRGSAGTGARKLLALKPSPEGVTVCPNGQVFLSLDDGQIIRVAPENPAPELWTTLSGIEPAGISCDDHDQLFVAVYAVRSGSAKPGVMHIAEQGAQGTMLPAPSEASPLAAYNGVLAIAGHGVYATDSGAGWVVHTHKPTPGGEYVSEIVARDIPIANGLAYDTAHQKLYVASSLDFAVYTFDLAADGSLQNRSKVKTSSASFFDGAAVDENGEVYAADYSGNQLLRLSDAKTIATLPTPASLAFRGGTLLITDYRLNQPEAEGGLYAIDLGACSAQRLR